MKNFQFYWFYLWQLNHHPTYSRRAIFQNQLLPIIAVAKEFIIGWEFGMHCFGSKAKLFELISTWQISFHMLKKDFENLHFTTVFSRKKLLGRVVVEFYGEFLGLFDVVINGNKHKQCSSLNENGETLWKNRRQIMKMDNFWFEIS